MEKNKLGSRAVEGLKLIADAAFEFVPGVNAAYQRGKTEYNRSRERAFFKGLGDGIQQITPELMESNDFLYAFMMTQDASLRSSSEDKASRFGRLLELFRRGEIESLSSLEQTVATLSFLTESEWKVALALRSFVEQLGSGPAEVPSAAAWRDKRPELAKSLGLSEDELDALCFRLQGQGLVRVVPTGGTYANWGSCPFPTPILAKLIDLIETRAKT